MIVGQAFALQLCKFRLRGQDIIVKLEQRISANIHAHAIGGEIVVADLAQHLITGLVIESLFIDRRRSVRQCRLKMRAKEQ